MFDAVKVKNECVAWIRDFFEKNGNVSYSSEVHYWSLSLNEETCNKAYALEMDEYWDEPYVTVTDYDRCYGLFVRPVTQ